MSQFFRSASRLNKTKYTFQLVVSIKHVRLHPMHNEKEVIVIMKKGGNKSTCTATPRKPGAWSETLSMVVTLYRDSHGRYQEKKYTFLVKQAGTNKTLATFKLDASHFASAAGTKEQCSLQSINPKDDGRIVVEVSCAFLRQLESQGSEVSSVISSISGEELGEEQDLSGWGAGGEVDVGDEPAGPSLGGFASSNASPSSPLSPAVAAAPRKGPYPSSSATPTGAVPALSSSRLPNAPRQSCLRPPRQTPSSPARPQAQVSTLPQATASFVQEREELLERLTRLEDANAALSADKAAKEQDVLSLRAERAKDRRLLQEQAAVREETLCEFQRRAEELERAAKDRDAELSRVKEALAKREVDVSTRVEKETGVEKESHTRMLVQEAEERWEAMRRAKEEQELESTRARAAAAAEIERLRCEVLRLKQAASSPELCVSPERRIVGADEGGGEGRAEGRAGEVGGAETSTGSGVEGVQEERLALVERNAELMARLTEFETETEERSDRLERVERERSELTLRMAEMEKTEEARRAREAEAGARELKEVVALRAQVMELERQRRSAMKEAAAMQAEAAEMEMRVKRAEEIKEASEGSVHTAGDHGEQGQLVERGLSMGGGEVRARGRGKKAGRRHKDGAHLSASSREVERGHGCRARGRDEGASARDRAHGYFDR